MHTFASYTIVLTTAFVLSSPSKPKSYRTILNLASTDSEPSTLAEQFGARKTSPALLSKARPPNLLKADGQSLG